MRPVTLLFLLALAAAATAQEEFAAYRPAPVRYTPPATVEPLPSDLESVDGLATARIPPAAREVLARTGFAIIRRGRDGFLDVYEDAAATGVAVLYTEDLFLHVYGRVLARTLHALEDGVLVDALDALARSLAAEIDRASAPGRDRGTARAWAHVLLALGGDLSSTPLELEGVVARELASIAAADGLRVSALLGREIDYSLFRPSPAYAASPRRLAYFHRLVWAGSVGFREDGFERAAADRLARALEHASCGSDPARRVRADLAASILFFSGAGADPDLEDGPPVAERLGVGDPSAPPEVRFLPRTALPDAHVLQELAWPRVGDERNPRLFPSALDVWSVFGSERARAALEASGAGAYPGYDRARLALAERFAPFFPFEDRRWGRTLYWGFLHAARVLLDPDADAPWAFARSEAWADRRLATCLGARVDGQLEGPPGSERRTGVLDASRGALLLPHPLFFARLEALVRMAREGILARDLLRGGLPGPGRSGDPILLLDRFEALLATCRELAISTREGCPFSAPEREFLSGLAAELARLPVHPDRAGGSTVAFTLHVRGRGTYHLVESTGPVDDLWVVGPGPALHVGPVYRWGEAVVPDPPPSGVLETETPDFLRAISVPYP